MKKDNFDVHIFAIFVKKVLMIRSIISPITIVVQKGYTILSLNIVVKGHTNDTGHSKAYRFLTGGP